MVSGKCKREMNAFDCDSYPHLCTCDYYGDLVKECSCTAMAISRYQKKISGPLLDRIDIYVEVTRVDYENLADKRNMEDSKTFFFPLAVIIAYGVQDRSNQQAPPVSTTV